MLRQRLLDLKQWLRASNRKPLILCGARQVGKTWLIRQFAKQEKKQLIELNFEQQPSLQDLFNSNDPNAILLNLAAFFNIAIKTCQSILFLDEIQMAPEIISKLRWFAEQLPDLAVVAAGSLLDFVLDQHQFSMPVGRVNYMYLEPMSFEEYLQALQKNNLVDFIANYQLTDQIALPLHQQLMSVFKEYLIIGGMPAVVADWIENKNLHTVSQIQSDLLASYRADFAKYAGKLDILRLEEVIHAIPKMLGDKFVYKQANPNMRSETIAQALQLLTKARICQQVFASHANGVPLAAEINRKYFVTIQ